MGLFLLKIEEHTGNLIQQIKILFYGKLNLRDMGI